VYLHDCLYLGNVLAYGLARGLRKPVVITQHIDALPYANRLFRALMAAANRVVTCAMLRGSSATVFISQKVRRYFEARMAFPRRPLYIPNGLDLGHFAPVAEPERQRLRAGLGLSPAERMMLFVGRFVERKGMPLLRQLAAAFPACQWFFIGRGQPSPSSWGLPNVRCLGCLAHAALADHYRAADLLVLPSRGEGFPVVVQEAMACGTPVLISDETARALPEIEAVALVSDLGIEQLKALVRAALEPPTGLQDRRRAAAGFAQRHWLDWDACARRYLDVFADLTGKAWGRRPQADGPARPPASGPGPAHARPERTPRSSPRPPSARG
jgi:glycosyltransferase involved in cell wall biosynthesis